MEQLSIDFGVTFKVGCRVGGEIQHYLIDSAYSVREARDVVREGVEGANPVLALVVNKEKMAGNKNFEEFLHTRS